MNDMTRERLQERRLHAMEILRQQKETVEQRQRQLLLKQMRDQEYETNVLQSIKQEYLILSDLFCLAHRVVAF